MDIRMDHEIERRSARPSRWRNLAVNLLVVVVYYAAARLGLLLAFEKTNASPVWPPSGIALAAILLGGRRVWPGIGLGAFLANEQAFRANLLSGELAIAAVSAGIALGNTLEAVVGGALVRRWVKARSPFVSVPTVFKGARGTPERRNRAHDQRARGIHLLAALFHRLVHLVAGRRHEHDGRDALHPCLVRGMAHL